MRIFISFFMPKLATCLRKATPSAPGTAPRSTSGFAAWILGRCALNSGLPSGYGVLPSTVPPPLVMTSVKTALFCLPQA